MSKHAEPVPPEELLPTRWSLIKRLKDKADDASWTEFFNLYWKLIYGVARKSGLSDAEAQEVVQTTVISVSKKIEEFKADPSSGSFKGWLLRLTRWRIIDQVRRRPPEYYAQHGTDSSTARTSAVDRVPDPMEAGMDELWEREWEANLLNNALERLQRRVQAKHYQVYHLHVVREIPPAKVAATMGIELEQVYVIKNRLSKLLREILQRLRDNPTGS